MSIKMPMSHKLTIPRGTTQYIEHRRANPVETGILTPKKLFMKPVHYIIPPFQRPYVWLQDDQWDPLWEDIRNVAEDYLEKMKCCQNNATEATQQTNPHFLGAVVIKQIPTATEDIEQREVIDGQQRVTTLQLLLDAIQQICEETNLPHFKKPAYRLDKYVVNDKELIVDEHHIFKLWPTRSDRDAFKHAMDNGLAVDDFKESLIVKAHEFFQLQVRNWLNEAEPIEPRIDALEAAATSLLQMVVIDLSPQDDPNLIFETLNARGTPLEQSDLIKNLVIVQGQDPHSDIWEDLDDGWWRTEIRQGRLFRSRLDVLLNYWLAMRMGSNVSPSDVFDEFRKYVKDKEIRTVMSGIKQDLNNYRDFESKRGRDPEEESFYYHIDVMQANVITLVLLLLLPIEKETRIRAFDVLESFLVRRMICRRTTKGYNNMILELTGRLQVDGGLNKADIVTAEFFKEQTAYGMEWPRDEDVTKALEDSPLYRLLTKGRLRLILEGVESQLRSSGKAEQSTVPKKQTIEHLMPISWKEDVWPLPEGMATDTATHQRNTLIHSIGNLTLVTNKLNPSLSNDSWAHKREKLQEHSVLLVNNELLSQPSWNEDAIQARGRRMAELISKRWPGPDSQKWA